MHSVSQRFANVRDSMQEFRFRAWTVNLWIACRSVATILHWDR